MRRLTTILTLLLLGAPGLAAAATPGATCRTECRPRIEEQCGPLRGVARRRCRRPLLRACRTTTPAIACQTTADLADELGDRRIATGDPARPDVTLCADGRFSLRVLTGAPGSPIQVITRRTGGWTVQIVDGALVVAFDDGTIAPLAVAHDADGRLLVDGEATDPVDATAACAPDAATPDPADEDAARVVALVRAVTDRALVIDAPDGNADERRELELCSSGRVVDTTVTQGASPTVASSRGTWTLRASGASTILALSLDGSGATPTFGIELDADGGILIDGAPVTQRDVRQPCADLDLADRLTAALGGRAFFFVRQIGTIPLRTKLGLCDSGRYRLVTTSTQTGTWRVRVSDGVGAIAFEDEAGAPLSQRFATAFDASGGITVEGTPPVDDPTLADAACQP